MLREISDAPDRVPTKPTKAPGEISDALVTLPTEPTKTPFVSFLSTSPSTSENPDGANHARETLHRLHGEHAGRLHAAGINRIARVLLTDWRAALGVDQFEFAIMIAELEQSGQIIREHGYARPNPDLAQNRPDSLESPLKP
jgi:hypothetical protein